MPSVVLVIDDDHEHRRSVVRHLRLIKYGVLEAAKSEEALACLERHDVDLILLEVALGAAAALGEQIPGNEAMPPGSGGYDLLEIIRAGPRYTPVIVLTAMDRQVDELTSIRGGADTFLRKPVEMNLLTAYVRSNLQRSALVWGRHRDDLAEAGEHPAANGRQSSILHAGDLSIDRKHRLVRIEDGPYFHLSEQEIRILTLLANSPGKVFTKQDLVRKIWGSDADRGEQAVESAIKRIRKKIEPEPRRARYILNARGMGYRFSTQRARVELNPNN